LTNVAFVRRVKYTT